MSAQARMDRSFSCGLACSNGYNARAKSVLRHAEIAGAAVVKLFYCRNATEEERLSTIIHYFFSFLSKYSNNAFSAFSASAPLKPWPAPSSVRSSASTVDAFSLSTSQTACS